MSDAKFIMAQMMQKQQIHTLVIAVKTFSRIALDWAFCGPLAWIFRPMAHGLAINLKWRYHYSSDHNRNSFSAWSKSWSVFFADHSYQDLINECAFYPTRKCNIGGLLLHCQVLESISEFKLNTEVYKHFDLNSISLPSFWPIQPYLTPWQLASAQMKAK